ncbi:MAG: DNA-binding domain-containing protein [Rubrivivax sp.]
MKGTAATPSLIGTQLRFQQHVLGIADDAADLLAGSDSRRRLGLAIYANAYRMRLVEALADAHGATRTLLGAEPFEAFALAFIAAHTPSTRNLRWYGSEFADHLSRALPQRPLAGELARLDWALRSAFDGPDSNVLAAEQLAQLPGEAWADGVLVLVPTAQLLRFQCNTVAVWQALNDNTPAPPEESSAAPTDWLVWRKRLQPHFRSLHAAEATLLRAMQAGASFAAACEATQRETETGADFIGSRLRQWLEDEVLAEFRRA